MFPGTFFTSDAEHARQLQRICLDNARVRIGCNEACNIHVHTVASLPTYTSTVTTWPRGRSISVEAAEEVAAFTYWEELGGQTICCGEPLVVGVTPKNANVLDQTMQYLPGRSQPKP